jgi:protoporphyrinogen oxidase
MILGGGIAGLYTAHQLLKRNPDRYLMIIEKEKKLGGRIHTFKDKQLTVEAGAGRFSKNHKLLLELIHELHLDNKLVPIPSSFEVAEPSPYNLKFILGKIIAFSKIDLLHDLVNLSFIQYARLIVSKEEVQYIEDSFGYYTELVVMNARDAIELLLQLNDDFFILKDGLSQIIDGLVKQLKLYPNVKILNEEVVSIQSQNKEYRIRTNKNTYTTPYCICTLPSNVVKKLAFFKPLAPFLRYITTAPLCRIYTIVDNKQFKNLPKMTTKTPLRMILPSSKVVMFYSDNKYAMYWKDIYEKHGLYGVNKALKYYVKELLDIEIEPKHTKIFYWHDGVGYWTVGARKEIISNELQNPFPHFYMCGEHYSASFQQWMEGALETSQKVVDSIQ